MTSCLAPQRGVIGRWLGAAMALWLSAFLTVKAEPPHVGAGGYDYRVVAVFSGEREGRDPYAGVIEGIDGHLYGTTTYGGSAGVGTVYQIKARWRDKVVDTLNYAKGANPAGELVQGSDGNLYGATSIGGTNITGTVFRLASNGEHTVLHSFGPDQDGNTDGTWPVGLCEGLDGNFYGLTAGGGAFGRGTAFRITPAGEFTVLHNFGAPTDAGTPISALILGQDGQFYGTASGGPNDGGTVFRMSPSGEVTILHAFVYCQSRPCQPYSPAAGLSANSNGDLFGTTTSGGTSNLGTVYKVSADGTMTVLHSFAGTDGLFPYGPVTLATDGRLYGTVTYGGPGYYEGNTLHGAVFTMLPDGSLFRLLHVFKGGDTDGAYPVGRLLEASDGRLYGTTARGGVARHGTVFALTPK